MLNSSFLPSLSVSSSGERVKHEPPYLLACAPQACEEYQGKRKALTGNALNIRKTNTTDYLQKLQAELNGCLFGWLAGWLVGCMASLLLWAMQQHHWTSEEWWFINKDIKHNVKADFHILCRQQCRHTDSKRDRQTDRQTKQCSVHSTQNNEATLVEMLNVVGCKKVVCFSGPFHGMYGGCPRCMAF